MSVSSPVNPPAPLNPRAQYAGWVAPLCWSAVALEGFDLVVLGVVLPSLLKESSWGLNPNSASLISVVGLIGVMVGALAIGTISDIIGRRKTVLLTVISFSVFTLLCAFAPNPQIFAVLRFLAGLGLGGVLPTAIALVNEYARIGRGGRATTSLMTGYHVGAVLTALIGILVIESLGWRSMFVIGALPALVLVPLLWRFLPESTAFLQAKEAGINPAEAARAERPAKNSGRSVALLFKHGLARSTIAFWVTSFMGLLLVYGLNTWLPQIMRAAGYELGAALGLLLVLNVGAVVGLLFAGRVADRIGNRRSTVIWFATAAVFLALLQHQDPRGRHLSHRAADRDLRVQRAGPGLRLRRPGLSRLRSRRVAGRGRGHRSAGRHRRSVDHGGTADGRDRLPVGLLRVCCGGGDRRGRGLAGQPQPGPRRGAAGHRDRR